MDHIGALMWLEMISCLVSTTLLEDSPVHAQGMRWLPVQHSCAWPRPCQHLMLCLIAHGVSIFCICMTSWHSHLAFIHADHSWMWQICHDSIEGRCALPQHNVTMLQDPCIPTSCCACAQNTLQKYQPRASIVPAKLDFTECPYAWPFCRQPIYANAMPLMFNATVLNGMGLIGAPCCE